MKTALRAIVILIAGSLAGFGNPAATSRCDANHDGSVTVADVQVIINEALGVAPPTDDPNNDGAVNVVDVYVVIYAAIGPGCTGDVLSVSITSPANLSYINRSPITVNGTVSGVVSSLSINGIAAPVANGLFSASIPLIEGANIITAVARTASGSAATGSIDITLDTTPPHLSIDSPPPNFVTADSTVTVRGLVNDIVLGTVNGGDAQVSVNGVAAQVANRNYAAAGIPLVTGDNLIQVLGQDQAGNAATASIHVQRTSAAQPRITVVSGANQTGPIGTTLPQPLVALVTDAAGQPAANQPVIFSVTASDGALSAGGSTSRTLNVTTDAQGKASVQFQLGTRAGAGNNAVTAVATGFAGPASFSATALAGAAAKLLVDIGNNQTGAAGAPLATPFVAIVTDSGNNRLSNVLVTFAVTLGGGSFAGSPTYMVNTDTDGRAQTFLTLGPGEGPSNNAVTATVTGSPALSVTFIASALIAGDPSNTSVSGVVLDNSNVPIPGVTMRLYLRNASSQNSPWQLASSAIQTDAQGQFQFTGAPVGLVKLDVDGLTAQRAGTWAHLEFEFVTVSGRNNTSGGPIYLLPLDTNHQLCVSPTAGGTLTLPAIPGFALTVQQNSVTFPGGSRTGCITVTVIHPDKVPMAPTFGIQPRLAVTVQPPGMMIEPPAALQVPNVDGLPPGRVVEMLSYDHDLIQFVSIGPGTVSEDGMTIHSNPGVGIFKGGWFLQAPPKQERCILAPSSCTFSTGQCSLDSYRITSLDALAQGSLGARASVKASRPRTAGSSAGTVYATGDKPVQLEAQIDTNCGNVIYTWDFGDGSPLQTGPQPTVSHPYPASNGDGISDPANYTVLVTAICKGPDQSQCDTKTAAIPVTIFSVTLSTVHLPNPTSPLDDRRVPVKGIGNPLTGQALLEILPAGSKPPLQALLLAGDGNGPQVDGMAEFDDDDSVSMDLNDSVLLPIKGVKNSQHAMALRLSVRWNGNEVAFTQFSVRTWPTNMRVTAPFTLSSSCLNGRNGDNVQDLYLRIPYQFDSESGNANDIGDIYVGEFLTDDHGSYDILFFQSPWVPHLSEDGGFQPDISITVSQSFPTGLLVFTDYFSANICNPTLSPCTLSGGSLILPITAEGTFVVHQKYVFIDSELMGDGQFIAFPGLDSISITKSIVADQSLSQWDFVVFRSGVGGGGCSFPIQPIVVPFKK